VKSKELGTKAPFFFKKNNNNNNYYYYLSQRNAQSQF
jgi:hypothetical protein